MTASRPRFPAAAQLTRARRALCFAGLSVIVLAASGCASARGAALSSPTATARSLNVSVVAAVFPTASVPTPTPTPAQQTQEESAPQQGEASTTTLVAQPARVSIATAGESHWPVRLQIPAIGVDAPVVPLGETATGAMATPDQPMQVGWWEYGPAPGERGSAVIGGHLDFHGYGPAVFWNLRKLRRGDDVRVVLADGRTVRFTVQSTEVYPENDTAIIDRIFRANDATRLNLITCAGTFNPLTRDYDKRLVVYTVLAS